LFLRPFSISNYIKKHKTDMTLDEVHFIRHIGFYLLPHIPKSFD